ncbi:MAG: thiol peroxidase [Clostridiales bacterium]|nr:thiol peroxidase [Clostridiales bacterium]
MAQVRKGVFILGGNQVDLIGPELKVGDEAPDFTAVNTDLQVVKGSDFKGKVRIIGSYPSLDTPVCDREARRFNQEALNLHDDIVILAISMDLPFAQKRWCQATESDRIITLSDHREGSFGQAYGTLIDGVRLLSRAVFVVDKNDRLVYVEYVPAAAQEPDYEKVLEAAKRA